MGDWLSGNKLPPNLGSDPTQAAAAAQQMGQMPQQQGGLTGFLSNPLFQGALGAYLGAVGSPSEKGLGGAIMQGGLMGLNAFNQAQQQQLQLPLQQAQLEQARLTTKKLGMELKPLSPDEVSALDDLRNQLDAQKKAHQANPNMIPDVSPYETSFVNILESQRRAGTITGKDLVTAITSFRESQMMQQMINAQRYGMGGNIIQGLQDAGMLPGGQPQQGQSPQQGQPPQGSQTQGKQPVSFADKYPGIQIPARGQTSGKVTIPGLGEVQLTTNSQGRTMYYKPGMPDWADLP